MKPLMPEYERQLRAAARRLVAGADAAEGSVPPARSGLGSRLLLVLSSTAVVVVALGAIVLLGHRGSPRVTAPGAALPAVQYDCAPNEILRTKGRLTPIAHGTVGGLRWTLEVDGARHGLRSVQAGRFLLGGRDYGFCETGLDVELVNAGSHGIVYGLATSLYSPPIAIEGTTAHGTTAHPARAREYPATTRQVPAATLFVRALPAPACAYRGLGVVAPERRLQVIGGNTVLTMGMTGAFVGRCEPGALLQTPHRGSGPSTPQLTVPAGRNNGPGARSSPFSTICASRSGARSLDHSRTTSCAGLSSRRPR